MAHKDPEARRVYTRNYMRRRRAAVRTTRLEERQRRVDMRCAPVIDECAWAAGHFEGEGTITMTGRIGRLIVTLTSTDTEVIGFFQARWPGVMRAYQPAGNARLAHVWTLNGLERIERFLRDIEFYIHTDRVWQKLQLALQEIEDRVTRADGLVDRSRRRMATFRHLNRRGKPQIDEAYRVGAMPQQLQIEGPAS